MQAIYSHGEYPGPRRVIVNAPGQILRITVHDESHSVIRVHANTPGADSVEIGPKGSDVEIRVNRPTVAQGIAHRLGLSRGVSMRPGSVVASGPGSVVSNGNITNVSTGRNSSVQGSMKVPEGILIDVPPRCVFVLKEYGGCDVFRYGQMLTLEAAVSAGILETGR